MKNKGFTIIEMLVVIAVMTALVVLALVNINKTRAQTRDKVRLANIQEIRLAIEKYKATCGEYPARLDPNTSNGCPSGFTFKLILENTPTNPDYADEPIIYTEAAYEESATYKGYLYAGLTNTSGGKCFDYHIGVPLESNRTGNSYALGEQLSSDHDCDEVTLSSQPYNRVCPTSENDFDASNDAQYGVYDVRSAHNCA